MVGAPHVQRTHGPGQRSVTTRPDVTVGNILAQARVQKGLSLTEVAAVLKIPVKQLKGLEAGELEVFPAEIYARGAFSKYADFLGVRAEGTKRAFLRVLTGAREYVPLRVHRRKSWLAAQFTPRWIVAGVIGSIALVVGSYVAWQVASFVWLPALAVVQPGSGIVREASVAVSGTANAEAVVKVNGEQVLLNEVGVWGAEVGLHPGINVIQVEATNAAGRVRRVQKTVLLPRQ